MPARTTSTTRCSSRGSMRRMDLPVMPPVKPMLAKAVPEVPEGNYLYEPKWDGFRRNSSCSKRGFVSGRGW
jgi:ATP-dependent DNA ligase